MAELENPVEVAPFESEELARYNPVSWWAVASVILGGLSVLTLTGPPWWFLPVLALLSGAWALRAIRLSEGKQSGRRLAMAGIALSLLFASWAPADFFVHRKALYDEARQHAESWLDAVLRGDRYVAHQLSLQYYSRRPQSVPLEQYYSEAPTADGNGDPIASAMISMQSPQNQLEQYYQDPVLQKLNEVGSNGQVEFAGNVGQHHLGTSGVYVQQQFVLRYEENGEQKEYPFVIVMRLMHFQDVEDRHWNVEEVMEPHEAAKYL